MEPDGSSLRAVARGGERRTGALLSPRISRSGFQQNGGLEVRRLLTLPSKAACPCLEDRRLPDRGSSGTGPGSGPDGRRRCPPFLRPNRENGVSHGTR